MASSRKRTLPLVGFIIPWITFRIVLFPVPLEPRMVTISDCRTLKLTPCNAGMTPKDALSSLTSSIFPPPSAQVRFDYIIVIDHLIRCAFRQLGAVIDGNNPVGCFHENRHDMFYPEDGDAELFFGAGDHMDG